MRLRIGLGNYNSNGVADMTDAIDRQYRMRRLLHRRSVFRRNQPAAGEAADIVLRHIRAGKDGDDARRGRRGARIDAAKPGASMWAPQDIGVELPGPVDVVGVSALSGQEPV